MRRAIRFFVGVSFLIALWTGVSVVAMAGSRGRGLGFGGDASVEPLRSRPSTVAPPMLPGGVFSGLTVLKDLRGKSLSVARESFDENPGLKNAFCARAHLYLEAVVQHKAHSPETEAVKGSHSAFCLGLWNSEEFNQAQWNQALEALLSMSLNVRIGSEGSR